MFNAHLLDALPLKVYELQLKSLLGGATVALISLLG